LNIVYLTDSEFKSIVELVKLTGAKYPESNNYAFTMTMGGGSVIIYNKDSDIDEDLKKIVIQHERAHYNGVYDEEEADRWALKRLNKRQRKMLVENWEVRHGHAYRYQKKTTAL
jgi:hypothetical protein